MGSRKDFFFFGDCFVLVWFWFYFCFLKMGDTNTYLHIDGLDPVVGKKFMIQESKGYKL